MKKLIRLAPLLLVATPLVTLSCTKSKVENEDVIILRETFLDRREMNSTPQDPISIRRVVIDPKNPTELIISYDVAKITALAMVNYFLPEEQRVNSKNVINRNARSSTYIKDFVKISLVELYEEEIIETIQESLVLNDKIHNSTAPEQKSVELTLEWKPQDDIPDTSINESEEIAAEINISLVFRINTVNNNTSGLVLVIDGRDDVLNSDHVFDTNAVKAELEKYPTSDNEDTTNDIRWARQLNIEIIKAIKSFPTR